MGKTLAVVRNRQRNTRLAAVWIGLVVAGAASQPQPSGAQTPRSLRFIQNEARQHEYGRQLLLPAGFGAGEFTLELWIKPDATFPVGPAPDGQPDQLVHWASADVAPYSANDWWFKGNFLLDGHNNVTSFSAGTFSLQFYGGGRVRWLFGDGSDPGPGAVWSVGAYPASATPSLLDNRWHQLTLVRRWSGVAAASLELWIDGVLIDSELSDVRTNMRSYWDTWPGFGAAQAGWFWGSEKQAAIGELAQYEDYKGLVDEVRFWSRAKSAAEIASDFASPVGGTEAGLAGVYRFDEGAGSSACNAMASGQCIQLVRGFAGQWATEGAPLGGGGSTPTPPVPSATPTPTARPNLHPRAYLPLSVR